MADTDKETLRKAAAKFGVELEPHERPLPSGAQAFAKKLAEAGPVSRLATESKPEGLAIPFANASPAWMPNAGWDNRAPAADPLPPPLPPHPHIAIPFANASPAWMPNGGYDNSAPKVEPLPPPKPPPPGTYVMGPNGPEPIMAAMGQPHCECKEPKA